MKNSILILILIAGITINLLYFLDVVTGTIVGLTIGCLISLSGFGFAIYNMFKK